MKTAAAKILTVVILAAVFPAARAATVSRTYSATPQSLSINGVTCPELVSWSGGDASARVVVESAGVGATPKKHIANVVYEPIIIEVVLPLSRALQNSLSDLCANRTTTQTLLLTNSDGTQLQATNALLTEARFPPLDSTGKAAWRLTLVFRPESSHPVTSGATGSGRGGGRSARSSNFRLTLAGLPGNQVSHIEAFTITRAAAVGGVGDQRDYTAIPGSTQIPDLSVTVAHAGLTDWAGWRDDFVVQGNSDDAKEKSGSLDILAYDLQTVMLPLQLLHVGIRRLALVPGLGEGPDTYRAELYCESMSVASVPVTGTTTPTSTMGTPATTPAPATPPAETAPADSKAPAKEPAKTPETAATESAPAPADTPAVKSETATNLKDKGSRDPADFPRPEGTIRTQYSAVKEPGFVQETANYTAKSKSGDLMVFYEKQLKGSGWEETARYENDNGTDHAHQITTTWKKDIRTVSMTFMDTVSGAAEIQVVLQARQK